MSMENEKEPTPTDAHPDQDIRHLLELALDETASDDDSLGFTEPPSIPGLRIGDYEVIDELGRGGMGVVYRARQCSLNRIVALKMILAASFASTVQRLRFFREAELIASLRHPNIVAIHEIGEHEGQPFYSMDFIEGSSLKDLIKAGPVSWSEAARLGLVIAGAMRVAHEHGVIHRDLKPQNILLDHLRNPHVADFGLAHDLNAEQGLTMTGDVIGTPNYMSPEQSTGSQEMAPATDVYAMGAILYEMLTSLAPFRGGSLAEILENIRTKEPIAPRLINPSIPRDLNTVCLKCLEKDTSRRYETAAELAEELERVLKDIPIKAKPVGPLEHGWRCRRNRTLALVLAGSFAIIVSGTITAYALILQQYKQAVTAKGHAETNAEDAERQRNLAVSANAATSQKNAELKKALDEITQQKEIIAHTEESVAQRDLDKAQDLFHQLRLKEAQTIADQIIATQPELAGAWYLKGELALAQSDLVEAAKFLNKSRSLDEKAFGAAGDDLLTLVSKYGDLAAKSPGGKLGAVDSLSLLRDLRGSEVYAAYAQSQEQTRKLLADLLRSVIAAANQGNKPTEDQVRVESEGDDVILDIENLPGTPDMSDAKNFPVFTALRLINTGVTDVSFVQGMRLSTVDIEQSPVNSIMVLQGMPLHTLVLKDTKVSDLSPLATVQLTTLILHGMACPPNNLLAKWPLQTLEIQGVPLPTSFTIPASVHTLSVADTGLLDLSRVAFPDLTSLDVSHNPVKDLQPLRSMMNLRSLDISDTDVTTVEPLAQLNLESLCLRNTHVGQLFSLKAVPLQELDIRGTYILDLDKLPHPPKKVLTSGPTTH
jgi:hypothetical protein